MKTKNPDAVKLGTLGGKARAKKYTTAQLSEMGKKGGRPRKDKASSVCKPIEETA